jgi:hypothetical protein
MAVRAVESNSTWDKHGLKPNTVALWGDAFYNEQHTSSAEAGILVIAIRELILAGTLRCVDYWFSSVLTRKYRSGTVKQVTTPSFCISFSSLLILI